MNHLSASGRFRPATDRLPHRSLHQAGFQRLIDRSGVTMIELLIVIAIIGVLTAIGMPQLTGIYSNQLVINAANELVSDIKIAQNKALANDQDQYAATPINDCAVGQPYVESYQFMITSPTQYAITRIFRSTSVKTGASCNPPSPETILSRNLPQNVQFELGEGESATYQTTSGQVTLSGGWTSHPPTNPIRVGSTRSTTKYYVCVDQARRVYAQTAACP